jgi:REP element-mobilizing transposase RayT
MARLARGETINPAEIQIVHCIQRCVRRAFLCGKDPVTGQSFEHRRGWIRDRLQFLASIFGIDCLTYTVLSNHAHIVLRSRPDVVASWSDNEVAQRWLRLYPQRRDKHGEPAEPSEPELNMIVNNPDRLAELRRRLSDISWWMGRLAEYIARRSNAEDNCTGRFWQGRYRGDNLLDEAALLACAMYVDLNPIRAAIAETPETSQFTGAKDRIDDLAARSDRSRLSDHDWQRAGAGQQSGWLSPIGIDEQKDELGPDLDTTGRRASRKGFLSISLTDYLQLLDWTGRAIRTDRRGSIPAQLAPILTRIGVNGKHWYELVTHFGKLFKRAAGSAENLAAEARRRGVRWLQGPGARLLSPASG